MIGNSSDQLANLQARMLIAETGLAGLTISGGSAGTAIAALQTALTALTTRVTAAEAAIVVLQGQVATLMGA